MMRSSRTRVVYVSHVSNLYGAARSLLDLAGAVVTEGVAPLVLVPEDGPLVELLNECGIGCDEFVCHPWVAPRSPNVVKGVGRLSLQLPSSVSIARKARAYGADIIHTNTSVIPAGAVAARFLNVPHVWHVREFGGEDYGLRYIVGEEKARRFMGLMSSKVVAVSEAVAREYRAYVSRGKLCSIYDGVNLVPHDARNVEIEGSFPRNTPPSVAIIGSLTPGKGQHEAIRAVRHLHAMGVEVQLTVIGTGVDTYREYLTELVAELGLEEWVEFAGFVDDVGLWIKDLDALLMCSRKEALGRVTVEAMLAGTPVVGARSGGTAEVIDHGCTGLLYTPGDPMDLAVAVRRILSSPELSERLAESGQEMASRQFDVEGQASRVIDVYERVLRNDRRGRGCVPLLVA